jgi:hypothetical protein
MLVAESEMTYITTWQVLATLASCALPYVAAKTFGKLLLVSLCIMSIG